MLNKYQSPHPEFICSFVKNNHDESDAIKGVEGANAIL